MTAILEEAKELVIDKWGTLNTAASPAKLPGGHSPDNQNVWMDEKPGSVLTANGYKKLGQIPSNNPPTLLLDFFKTSDGSSKLIVSDNESIWWTTDYVNYTLIKSGLSKSFQLRGKVIRNKVWFTNGSDDVATWDGTTYTPLNGTAGTPDVPTGKYIDYHDERVWIYGITSDLSACRFTALTNTGGTEISPDNSAAWPTDNEIQISEGDADQGTGIFLYRGYLYCSKQFSIWRIVGYDEYTYTRIKTRSSTGTRFQESIQVKDNLVHFIGVDGLYVFDGEVSMRISDPINPATPEDGVFSFNSLQQPLLNDKFWNISQTADIDNGTVPNNLDVTSDQIKLIPADDTDVEFNSGTHDDTVASGGNLQLDIVTSGGVENVASGKVGAITPGGGSGGLLVGSSGQLTDLITSSFCGLFTGNADNLDNTFEINLGSLIPVGRIVARSFSAFRSDSNVYLNSIKIEINASSSGGTWVQVATVSVPSTVSVTAEANTYLPGQAGYRVVPVDQNTSFSTISAWRVRYLVNANRCYLFMNELEVYRAGYEPDGKFISSSIDYGSIPASFGVLAATITTNGENHQFFTQSSSDGSTWNSETNLSNGSAIGSALARFLRWGVYLYSSTGLSTPVIDKVFVGSTYISEIHNTGGNILQWAAFQIEQNAAGQTINAYFRAGASSAAVSASSWTAIVPGAIPNTAITNTFIQIRLEFSTTVSTQQPVVQGFTVNWVVSSVSGVVTLQNVASFIWLNRYWLTAATLGSSGNDIVLVFGKSTAESPWHKKDFKLLSFCRFEDIFISGSSENGSLYRLEYGYSKNGAAMDSYYETRDFSNDGFQMKGREILVKADRSGPYNLSVGFSTDGGLTYTDKTIDLTRASGNSLSFTTKLNVNFMSDYVRFRVRTNAADQPFSVDALQCYYRMISQRGTLVVG